MRTFGNPGLALFLSALLAIIVALIAATVIFLFRRGAQTGSDDPDSRSEVILIALLVAGAFVLGLFVCYAFSA